jgi:nitrite reductase (NADH) small subunit
VGERTTVAQAKDIKPGEVKCVEFGGERVAVFNVDGAFHAISDTCPHAGGPLSEGYVEDGRVVCPWHGWCFDLDPEKCEPPNDMVSRYRVHVENGAIQLEATE